MPVQLPLKSGFFAFIQNPFNAWYKVLNPEPFNYRTGDGPSAEFTPLATNTQSGFINISNLEPSKHPPHLLYVVPGVEDTEIRYNIKMPAGTDRLGTDVIQNVGFIDAYRSPFHNPNPQYALWLTADFFPAINATNLGVQTMTPRVWFNGYKYDLLTADPRLVPLLENGRISAARIHIGGVNTSSGVN